MAAPALVVTLAEADRALPLRTFWGIVAGSFLDDDQDGSNKVD